MIVYQRVGRDTAVGFPFLVYVLFVLPVQALWVFTKTLVLLYVLLAMGALWLGRAAYRGWHCKRDCKRTC